MRAFFTAILVLALSSVKAQDDKVLLNIPAEGKTYKDFIPKGYDTLAIAHGDLDKDGQADMAIVMSDKLEREDRNTEINRPLLIAFKDGDKYKTVFKGTNVILCYACGGVMGDPFVGISIHKGVLKTNHYGGSAWRWAMTRVFRYQNGDFYLIGQTDESYWSVKQCENLGDEFAGTKYEDINLITGSRVIKEISEECELLVDKKDKITVKPLVKMAKLDLKY